MFRRTAFLGTLVAAAIALSACSGGAAPQPGKQTGAADPAASIDVGLVLEPTTLDIRHTAGAALEQILIDNIYQGLVSRTQDDKVVGGLATTHELSADGLTYDFKLAQGVKFHDGSPLTADDVTASLQTAKDDAGVNGHQALAGVASITAPDPSSIRIVLSKPDQDFLFGLTGPGGLVFKKGDTTDLKKQANGTGPFTFKSWKLKDSITFERNDAYWGKKAGVKEVVFHYIPDFNAGVNAALQDDVQVLTAVDPNLAQRFKGSDFALTTGKTTDKGTLAFNNKKAPLNDPKVRRALRLAIDHNGLIKALGGNKALYGPIPELDPGYQDLASSVPYDPEEAKKLLAEAGQKNLSLTLTIPNFYSSTLSQVLISDFKKVGVTLKVKSVEFPTWLNDVYKGKNYDLSFVLHVEARDFGNWANPEYYFNYDNPKVKELYRKSIETLDEKESATLRAAAAKIVSDDSAADWLYVGDTITAVQPQVHGFPIDSINSRINMAAVTVSK